MSEILSVHDYNIVAYTVLAKERRIVLVCESNYGGTHDAVDVMFEDVLAYDFEHDCLGSIVLDIVEVDLADLLAEHAQDFEEGIRWGWPGGWDSRKQGIHDYARELGMRAFELSASYGLSGWVIAKRMTTSKKEANQAPDPTAPSRRGSA